jgi:cell division protein FtsI/penicillin-binding protein 2
MHRVVNTRAGSGHVLRGKRGEVVVAGKTGTAEAAWLRLPVLDENRQQRRDETGTRLWETIQPSTISQENPLAPWYVGFDADGKNLKHSWIIGYAPANDPQVAFAVMVEYGGGGGGAAATIARGMLDAAIKQGYLSPDNRPVPNPDDVEASGR